MQKLRMTNWLQKILEIFRWWICTWSKETYGDKYTVTDWELVKYKKLRALSQVDTLWWVVYGGNQCLSTSWSNCWKNIPSWPCCYLAASIRKIVQKPENHHLQIQVHLLPITHQARQSQLQLYLFTKLLCKLCKAALQTLPYPIRIWSLSITDNYSKLSL